MDLTHASLVRNYDVFEGGPGGTDLGGEPGPVPLGSDLPLEETYAAARAVVDEVNQAWGTRTSGFKISMTSRPDQERVAAKEPAYGILTDAHLHRNHVDVALAYANSPLLEPELVVRTDTALDAAMDDDTLLAHLEVTAGLEIPVCRIPDWWPEGQAPAVTLGDFVRDNAAAGFLVHGDTWVPATSLDLTAVTAKLLAPDGTVHEGAATNVLGNPLTALRWLLEARARHGADVPAGSVVTTGTFRPPVRATEETWTATFSHDLGRVGVDFR